MSQSVFPERADHFQPFVDPDLESQALIKQYNAYIDAGNNAAATTLLNQNPKLRQMIVNADRLNLIQDGIENTQKLFLKIEPYILNAVNWAGIYDSTKKYKKFDVVTYGHNGVIEAYYAVDNDVPIGMLPTNSNYWVQVTVRGEQGASGTGMSQRGIWNDYATYYVDDCVSYNNKMWAAKTENINKPPDASVDDWVAILQVVPQVTYGENEPPLLENDGLWIEPVTGNDGFVQHIKKAGGGYVNIKLATLVNDKVPEEQLPMQILAKLVDGKIPEEQLPMTGGTFVGTQPPENTKLTWIDISLGADKGIQKYYNGTAWVPILATWG